MWTSRKLWYEIILIFFSLGYSVGYNRNVEVNKVTYTGYIAIYHKISVFLLYSFCITDLLFLALTNCNCLLLFIHCNFQRLLIQPLFNTF